jgi:hypothetical protein
MTKQQLQEEAKRIANLHEEKKKVIYKIFEDLDGGDKTAQKYIGCIAAVNEILKEMSALEEEHEKILTEIRK